MRTQSLQRLTVMALVFMNLSACVEFKETESEAPKPQAKIQSIASFKIHELDLPNRFSIEVDWPEESQHVIITANERVILDSPRQQRPLVFEARGGEILDLVVEEVISGNRKMLGDFRISIPQDFVFENDQSLASDLNIEGNRVYLRSGSRLVTNGFSVSIKAEKIFSDDFEFVTFSSDSQAKPMNEGKSGGAISLQARDASGRLFVHLRGQRGGNGLDGEPWETTADRGTDGAPGQVVETDSELRSYSQCVRQPTSGGMGAHGLQGRPGKPGERGGSSGYLYVQIENDAAFSITSTVEPGAPGSSGQGGRGQQGGPGGHPGASIHPCKFAKEGPPGEMGPPGISPPNKGNGEINQSIIIIGKTCSLVGKESRKCSDT